MYDWQASYSGYETSEAVGAASPKTRAVAVFTSGLLRRSVSTAVVVIGAQNEYQLVADGGHSLLVSSLGHFRYCSTTPEYL